MQLSSYRSGFHKLEPSHATIHSHTPGWLPSSFVILVYDVLVPFLVLLGSLGQPDQHNSVLPASVGC